mmetsp:Transcript_72063/g.208666  ORF Transcript_72063/g.208666 Transcript_72063/m.208666 type:complete len:208 (-) Transcript_72063:8-631(-)
MRVVGLVHPHDGAERLDHELQLVVDSDSVEIPYHAGQVLVRRLHEHVRCILAIVSLALAYVVDRDEVAASELLQGNQLALACNRGQLLHHDLEGRGRVGEVGPVLGAIYQPPLRHDVRQLAGPLRRPMPETRHLAASELVGPIWAAAAGEAHVEGNGRWPEAAHMCGVRQRCPHSTDQCRRRKPCRVRVDGHLLGRPLRGRLRRLQG